MWQPIKHFCCQNPDCPDRGNRGKGNLSFRGWCGGAKRIRVIYCKTCKDHFSERKGTILSQSHLTEEKAVALLEHVREGCGTRATARLVGVDKNTVTRYIKLAGAHAQALHDELLAFSPSDV
ncbi:helix-turn-helix domain-containing protein [Planctomycetota bacterium]